MTFDLEASLEEMVAPENERRFAYGGGISTPSRILLKPETEVCTSGLGPVSRKWIIDILESHC